MSIILGIILAIATIGFGSWCGFACYKRYSNTHDSYGRKIEDTKGKETILVQIIISALLCVASLIVFVFVPFSIHQVDAGEVAVVKVWGNAKEVRTSGIHYDLWLSHKYEIYDCKVQQVPITTSAYSSDSQQMGIELYVQYQIQPENAMQIAKNYGGLEMLESRISTVSIERTKSVLSQYKAEELIKNRQEMSKSVSDKVSEAITSDYYVNITTVVLTNIDFSDAFEKSVEDKMIAEQEKLKAEYEKEKAIIQAEQELETAKLRAEAQIAEAQANAKSIELVANANARAIKIKSVEIARMMGFAITETKLEDSVEYDIDFSGKTSDEIKVISDYLKYIEYLESWDGKLPETLVTDGNASIIIPTTK